MRKLRALVITSDKIMGSAFCDIVKLEGHLALLVTSAEEWQIACEIYMPDIILSYDSRFFSNIDMIDCFCGRVPIILTAWGHPDSALVQRYTGYGISYLKAPCGAEDVLDAFYKATLSIKSDLFWLDR